MTLLLDYLSQHFINAIITTVKEATEVLLHCSLIQTFVHERVNRPEFKLPTLQCSHAFEHAGSLTFTVRCFLVLRQGLILWHKLTWNSAVLL